MTSAFIACLAMAAALFAQDMVPPQTPKVSASRPVAVIVADEPDKSAAGAGYHFGERGRSKEEYQAVLTQAETEKEDLKSRIRGLEEENAQLKLKSNDVEADVKQAQDDAKKHSDSLKLLKNLYRYSLIDERYLKEAQLAQTQEELNSLKDKEKAFVAVAVISGLLSVASMPVAFALESGLGLAASLSIAGGILGAVLGMALGVTFLSLSSRVGHQIFTAGETIESQRASIRDIDIEIKHRDPSSY